MPALNNASPLYMSAFTVLHTLSHMLIKEFSAMSGFSLGSLAERFVSRIKRRGDAVAAAGLPSLHILALVGRHLGGLVQQAASVERVTNLINLSLEKCWPARTIRCAWTMFPRVVRKTVQRAMLACCFQKLPANLQT